MAEQEKKNKTTEENMQELFQLLDEKAASGELVEIEDEAEEAKFQKEMEEAMTPMTPSEQSAYEYSMMMTQYEAMLQDYQRREAEEKAAKEAAVEKEQ